MTTIVINAAANKPPITPPAIAPAEPPPAPLLLPGAPEAKKYFQSCSNFYKEWLYLCYWLRSYSTWNKIYKGSANFVVQQNCIHNFCNLAQHLRSLSSNFSRSCNYPLICGYLAQLDSWLKSPPFIAYVDLVNKWLHGWWVVWGHKVWVLAVTIVNINCIIKTLTHFLAWLEF